MTQAQAINARLQQHRSDMDAVAQRASTSVAEAEQAIDQVLEKAGVLIVVKQLRREMENTVRSANLQKSVLVAKIEELQWLLQETEKHNSKISNMPATQTMHGIDLTALDYETRLMVQTGNRETIDALGGTYEDPKSEQ